MMYIHQLSITRFIAAISIVIIHFGLSTWPFNSDMVYPVMIRSNNAVSYFFLLSGFILVISSLKNNGLPEHIPVRKFWIHRCAHILPLYLFCVIIYFALHFEYNPNIALKWQIHYYVYSLFLLQSWKHDIALHVNYPAWALSVEAFFYFIFPWLYSFVKKHKSKSLMYTSLIIWLGNSLVFKLLLDNKNIPVHFTLYFPLLHVSTFILGVIAGILFIRHYTIWNQKINWGWTITGLSFFFLLFAAYHNMVFFKYQHNGLLAPFFIVMIYTLSLSKGWLLRFLSWKPFMFMGEISYAIYVLQVIVIEIATRYIPFFQGKGYKDIFYYYIVLLIISSIMMHLVFEKPLRFMIKKWA